MMPVPVPLYDVRSQKLRERIREQNHPTSTKAISEPKLVELHSPEDYFDIQKLRKQREHWTQWNSHSIDWEEGGVQTCKVGYVIVTGEQKKKMYAKEIIQQEGSNFEKIRKSKKKNMRSVLIVPSSSTKLYRNYSMSLDSAVERLIGMRLQTSSSISVSRPLSTTPRITTTSSSSVLTNNLSKLNDSPWDENGAGMIVKSLAQISKTSMYMAEMLTIKCYRFQLHSLKLLSQKFPKSTEEDAPITPNHSASSPSSLLSSSSSSEAMFVKPNPQSDITMLPTSTEVMKIAAAKRNFHRAKENADLLANDIVDKMNELKSWNGVYFVAASPFFDHTNEDRSWMKEYTSLFSTASSSPSIDYKSNEEFIQHHLFSILRKHGHPFNEAIRQFLAAFQMKFYVENQTTYFCSSKVMFQHHLRNNILLFCGKLQQSIIVTFKSIDMIEYYNLIFETVKDELLSQLFPSLLPFYLQLYGEKDAAIELKVTKLRTSDNITNIIGVDESIIIALKKQNILNRCFKTFSKITKCRTPTTKIRTIGKTIGRFSDAIEEYYMQLLKLRVSLAPKDILSALLYVMIMSKVTCLYSQCKYIYDFLSDETTLGEDGYALAVFDTAIYLLKKLDSKCL